MVGRTISKIILGAEDYKKQKQDLKTLKKVYEECCKIYDLEGKLHIKNKELKSVNDDLFAENINNQFKILNNNYEVLCELMNNSNSIVKNFYFNIKGTKTKVFYLDNKEINDLDTLKEEEKGIYFKTVLPININDVNRLEKISSKGLLIKLKRNKIKNIIKETFGSNFAEEIIDFVFKDENYNNNFNRFKYVMYFNKYIKNIKPLYFYKEIVILPKLPVGIQIKEFEDFLQSLNLKNYDFIIQKGS